MLRESWDGKTACKMSYNSHIDDKQPNYCISKELTSYLLIISIMQDVGSGFEGRCRLVVYGGVCLNQILWFESLATRVIEVKALWGA